MNLEALKKAKLSLYLVALIEFAIGLIFIIYPKFSLSVIAFVVSLSFLVQGLVRVYHFFKDSNKLILAKGDFVFGVALVVLGILLLFARFQIDSFIGAVLAIMLTLNGLSKLKVAFDLKKLDFSFWWLTAVLALLTIVLAVALFFNLSTGGAAVAVFIGVSLLFDAMLNFMAAYSARTVR